MKEYKRLGDYIREVNVRNRELKVAKLVGLTIDKAFIPSVANVIGTGLPNNWEINSRAPEGQSATSIGHRPMFEWHHSNAPQGQKLMPLQGDGLLCIHSPKALPWADRLLPLQGVSSKTQLPFRRAEQ